MNNLVTQSWPTVLLIDSVTKMHANIQLHTHSCGTQNTRLFNVDGLTGVHDNRSIIVYLTIKDNILEISFCGILEQEKECQQAQHVTLCYDYHKLNKRGICKA